VDRISTRIGASDDLQRGQSTFMVEMCETANILNHAASPSLIVLNEIGRGTSTFARLAPFPGFPFCAGFGRGTVFDERRHPNSRPHPKG
jgi:hypothetical protein